MADALSRAGGASAPATPHPPRSFHASGAAVSRRCPTCAREYPADFVVCPKDASRLDRLVPEGEDALVGEVLGGSYFVSKLLGEGAMGRVYEAEHVRLPRRVAVKVLHESLARHPDAVARFEREAQAVARVIDDHVVDVIDVLRLPDGRPCLVTELLEGEELGELLERAGKLPVQTAVTMTRQVCRALAAAHAAGVVHRDLKPSNLFVVRRRDGAPFVKVLDFGVAKLSDGAHITRTGAVIGTPAYMAPEQARGAPGIDARADIYAAGAVLYHMLTGSPPYPDAEPARVLTRLLTEDPPRPRSLCREIPEVLELAVQRAMARDPAQRPASALDLDRQLAPFGGPAGGGDAASLGTQDTLCASGVAPPEPPRGASFGDEARRATAGRPLAVFLALGAPLALGAATLASTSAVFRATTERPGMTMTELVLLGILAAVVLAGGLAGTLRQLTRRWRSGPATERLGRGLLFAALTLLAGVGALVLGLRAFQVLVTPSSLPPLTWVDAGAFALPLAASLVALVQALRKADA